VVRGFDFLGGGLGIFYFLHHFQTGSGPTQPSIQGVSGALSLGIKRPGREADHPPPASAEVKNAWSYTSTPNTSSWRGVYLRTGTILPFSFT
jgi:hypothetical protein